MEQVKRLLQNHFGSASWEVARSQDGQQNGGYHAHHGDMAIVFSFLTIENLNCEASSRP